MKKRLIVSLMVLAVLFGFVSCSKKTQTTATPVAPQSSAVPAQKVAEKPVAAPAPAPAKSEKITLTLWNSSQTMVDWYNASVIPEFLKQNPDVGKVDILYMPIQDFTKKLAVVLPAGDVPDIMEIEDSWATPYVTAGYFDKNTPELDNILSQMLPEFQGNLTYNGKHYGVPVAPFHELFFYNLDMMKEAGITAIPDTMDEVIQDAIKMTKTDENGKITRSGFSMRLGGNPSGTCQKFWVLGLLPNGVDIYEESKKTPGKYHCGFDNEGGYAALKLYIDMLYKYKVDDFASMKDTAAFAKEKTAINMREASSSNSIIAQGPNVNWISAPMPKGAKQRATFLISLNLYVPKDGKHKDLARKFIALATSREMQAIQVKERAGYNPYKDANKTEGLDPRLVPSFQTPSDMHVYTVPVQNSYDQIQTKIGELLPNIFAKKELLDNPEGIKQEIHNLAKIVNDVYKENDEYGE